MLIEQKQQLFSSAFRRNETLGLIKDKCIFLFFSVKDHKSHLCVYLGIYLYNSRAARTIHQLGTLCPCTEMC